MVIVKDYIQSSAFLVYDGRSETFAQEVALTTDKQRSKDPNKYLLTNRLDATVTWVIRCYQSRWQIECEDWFTSPACAEGRQVNTVFRETKQHFALGACTARKFDAVTQQIAMSFLGFVCLQQLRANLPSEVKDGLTLGDWRRELQQWYRVRIGSNVSSPTP